MDCLVCSMVVELSARIAEEARCCQKAVRNWRFSNGRYQRMAVGRDATFESSRWCVTISDRQAWVTMAGFGPSRHLACALQSGRTPSGLLGKAEPSQPRTTSRPAKLEPKKETTARSRSLAIRHGQSRGYWGPKIGLPLHVG